MERMLLPTFRLMSRKVLVLLVILIASGVAPATAVLGFCAQMPCCASETGEGDLALATQRADCCTTINCYEGPSQNLQAAAKATVFTSNAASVVPFVSPTAAPDVRRVFNDGSPPRSTGDRLAALSVFLI